MALTCVLLYFLKRISYVQSHCIFNLNSKIIRHKLKVMEKSSPPFLLGLSIMNRKFDLWHLFHSHSSDFYDCNKLILLLAILCRITIEIQFKLLYYDKVIHVICTSYYYVSYYLSNVLEIGVEAKALWVN